MPETEPPKLDLSVLLQYSFTVLVPDTTTSDVARRLTPDLDRQVTARFNRFGAELRERYPNVKIKVDKVYSDQESAPVS